LVAKESLGKAKDKAEENKEFIIDDDEPLKA